MPARNDPCPCGSGRKYKKCCADIDARRDRTLRLIGSAPPNLGHRSPGMADVATDAAMRDSLRAAARSGDWQADVVPLNIGFDDAPDDRGVSVLVVAGDMVLEAELASMRAGEAEDVARMIADRVGTAAWSMSHWPHAVRVRHASVAPALAAALAPHDVKVTVTDDLPELDAAARALSAHMTGGLRHSSDPSAPRPSVSEVKQAIEKALADPGPPARPMLSSPQRWAAWGLPADLVNRIFAAAARFHDAAPWTNLYNTEPLGLAFPNGEQWTACVMGYGGQEFGLSLYSDLADFVANIEAADVEGGRVPIPRGVAVTLGFDPRDGLPRGMHREIRLGRWPLPAADVYPRLWCLNTPAGGISRAMANTLALALEAVPRFTTEYAAVLERHPLPELPLTWTDAATGVVVSYSGDLFDDDFSLWPEVTTLERGAATGPGADPEAIVTEANLEAMLERERAAVTDFEQWLQEAGPGRRRVGAASARRHAVIAEAFVDCLVGFQGATLGAIHEFDLRVFLYDWFPRKVAMGRGDAMRTPGSLARFFSFVADARGIVCPWAKPILDDRDVFAVRWEEFPGGHWWDEAVIEWRVALTIDLNARALLPSPDFAGNGTWGATMGMEEARLHTEVTRHRLQWREELIARGITDPAEVRQVLVMRQAEWELRGDPRHRGRSPSEVVRRERAKRPPSR